jgi:SP family xylose:H+ symportor-like MFS transporter
VVPFLGKSIPTVSAALQDSANVIKGFVVSSALIGCIIGAALAGFISKSNERKKYHTFELWSSLVVFSLK